MSDLFTQSAIVAVVAGGIRLAVPLLVASLGETYGQRSGVLNLGVDGIMLLGAFALEAREGYVYVREDVWEALRRCAEADADADLLDRMADWHNPSRIRPAALLRNR